MGIPSYFSLIIRKYKRVVQSLDQISSSPVHHFFLDCNSIVYDTFHAFTPEGPMGPFTEDKLIEGVSKKIDAYIRNIRPTKTIYIAFDGVAPMAKMEQQRNRRYKSAYLDPKSDQKQGWSTSNITPGTLFMDKLMTGLRRDYEGQASALRYGVETVILSTSDEPGEGEHKLFQYMREMGVLGLNEVSVVYGLDADLIMLSLFHIDYTKNIYVCREQPEFMHVLDNVKAENDALLFLDIAQLRSFVFQHIVGDIPRICPSRKRDIVNDYVFMCFFLGNDFLPHFPTLNIRTHGMDVLLDTYRHVLMKKGRNLIELGTDEKVGGRILWQNVSTWLQTLASMEHDLLLREHAGRDKLQRRLMADKLARDDVSNIPILYRADENYICPTELHWQTRYYRALFPDLVSVPEVCTTYLQGLEWTLRYYTSACPDWRWKYSHHYAPLLGDLALSVLSYNTKPPITNLAVTPIQQLRYVMPRNQLHLIPGGMNLDVNDYPEYAECTFAYRRYFWECHVSLPDTGII